MLLGTQHWKRRLALTAVVNSTTNRFVLYKLYDNRRQCRWLMLWYKIYVNTAHWLKKGHVIRLCTKLVPITQICPPSFLSGHAALWQSSPPRHQELYKRLLRHSIQGSRCNIKRPMGPIRNPDERYRTNDL